MPEPITLAALSVAVTAAAVVWSIQRGQVVRSAGALALTTLPGLLVLAAFYSLAIHMHVRLQGWPDFYGSDGLPQQLVAHADATHWVVFTGVLAALGMPMVLALFAAVPQLRAKMIYPALSGAACWTGLLLTALAPAGFQRWWWD